MKINVPRALTLAVFTPVLVTSVIPAIAIWWIVRLSDLLSCGFTCSAALRTAIDTALQDRHIGLSIIFLIAGSGLGAAIALRLWLNIKVKDPLDELIAILLLLASGDLRTRPSVTDRTQARQVFVALQKMHEGIMRTAQTVNSASQSIYLAAHEIDEGNKELSARTQQQASASEEIAEVLTRLTETVRQTSEFAEHLERLSQDATIHVERCDGLVVEAISAMLAVTEKSSRIGTIVDVIDDLAFQTNLLALNAAIEAAHAGNHGTGFAVVAAEVRALAKRSAVAADQIREVIAQSRQEVELGTSRVVTAGETIQLLVEANRSVSTLSVHVNNAAYQQHSAIERASGAVAQIDDSAQRVAALAEQTAAASHELASQTSHLQATASFWRLSEA